MLRNLLLSEKVEMEKNHPFTIFCSTAYELHSVGFSQPWRKSCKISGFFASWNFLMYVYHSNKRLIKTYNSLCYCKKEKHIWNRYRTNKLPLYQCHICFLEIFVCSLPRISMGACKTTVFSHLKFLLFGHIINRARGLYGRILSSELVRTEWPYCVWSVLKEPPSRFSHTDLLLG